MTTDSYRKCAKCRITPIQDRLVAFHRFPRAAKTNEERRRAWAKFCWPEQDWSTVDALAKIKDGKVLCKRHFRDIDFTDSTKTRLGKFSIPTQGINATNLTMTVENETTVVPQVHGVPNINAARELLVKLREEGAIAVSNHSKNQSVVSNSNNKIEVSVQNTNQTAVRVQNKNQTAVSVQNKKQTAVSIQNKNQTEVSVQNKNQTAVNINEDSLDDEYLAGIDTHTDDDCHNISDDDCQAVVDDDSSFYHNVSKLPDDKDDMDMGPHNLDKNEDLHDGFQCNYCSGEIKGYRYTCVQCPDYDLCGSCEARGAHCLHYVLRIPRPKPYTEIQPLLREIKRLLSRPDTDVLCTQIDDIKEEMHDDFDPLAIDVMPTSSETEDVPEMSTISLTTMLHGNTQDDNDTVPEVIKQPLLTLHLHNATKHTRQKETVSVDKRSAASTSSPYPRLVKSSPQAIDNTRTTVSDSSQYITSTRLAPDRNTVLTIESKPQVTDKTRKPVSASSPYLSLPRLAPKRNTLLTIESSPQAIDKTRTPASESSLFTAPASVSSDDNTVLKIATNVEDPDSASRSVPTTSILYASSSITPGDTETSNKGKVTADSRLIVPMATKRKCSDNIEASKHKVVLLKGSKKLIVVPSMSKVIVPGSRFKIIKKPSATEQPQGQVAGVVYTALHRTPSTQQDQDSPR